MNMEAQTDTASDTHTRIQPLQEAIQQPSPFLPSHDFQISTGSGAANESQILFKLNSQLGSLKEDGIIEQSESSVDAKVEQSSSAADGDVVNASRSAAEEIMKELRNVKRQNTVTHWLLSGLIVLTLVCQLSEVSMILKVRAGLNHPVSTLWSWFKGAVRCPVTNAQDAAEKQASSITDTLVESAPIPLKLTSEKMSHMDLELPQLPLPSLTSSGKDK